MTDYKPLHFGVGFSFLIFFFKFFPLPAPFLNFDRSWINDFLFSSSPPPLVITTAGSSSALGATDAAIKSSRSGRDSEERGKLNQKEKWRGWARKGDKRDSDAEREKMALQPDWHRKVGELTEKQKLQFLSIPEANFGSLSIKFSEGRKSHISTHSPSAPG